MSATTTTAQERYQVQIKKSKLQKRTKMNSNEFIGNRNGIYGERKEENSPELLNSGGAWTSSGQIRLMQRPLSRQWRRTMAAAELGC